jgi:LDH2 family malate/lactate/ureidoglycolate dehydrogenase
LDRSLDVFGAGPGVEIPNEQEQRYEAERLSGGISLDAETWRQLTTCATQLGLSEAELRELEKACLLNGPPASKL